MRRAASLPEEVVTRAPESGDWSIKDFVGHIASSQKAILFTAQQLAEGKAEGASGGDFDLDAWNARQVEKRRAWPLERVLAELDEVSESLAVLLANLPPEAWARAATVAVYDAVSV